MSLMLHLGDTETMRPRTFQSHSQWITIDQFHHNAMPIEINRFGNGKLVIVECLSIRKEEIRDRGFDFLQTVPS